MFKWYVCLELIFFHFRLDMKRVKGCGGVDRLCFSPQSNTEHRFYKPTGIYIVRTMKGESLSFKRRCKTRLNLSFVEFTEAKWLAWRIWNLASQVWSGLAALMVESAWAWAHFSLSRLLCYCDTHGFILIIVFGVSTLSQKFNLTS